MGRVAVDRGHVKLLVSLEYLRCFGVKDQVGAPSCQRGGQQKTVAIKAIGAESDCPPFDARAGVGKAGGCRRDLREDLASPKACGQRVGRALKQFPAQDDAA